MGTSAVNNINEVYIQFIENMRFTPSNTVWLDGYNCAIDDIIRALREQVSKSE